MVQEDTVFPKLRMRILLGPEAILGPGKADLLDLIRNTGSISAAGRHMGMSFKRASSLVDSLNAAFKSPLVESARGGPQGGGARLTEQGAEVLALYRRMEAASQAAIRDDVADLCSRLAFFQDEDAG